MRILWFNLATDLDDSILAFTTSWIREVAARVDSIHVITMRLGRVELPENVQIYSLGKEKGFSEPRRLLEFYQHLFHILKGERIDACFSHMIPIFSVLASPVLRKRKIPIVTWYAHRQKSFTLKLAHGLSRRMVSTNQSSYPYQSNKTTFLGQGIDTRLFTPDEKTSTADPPLILFVGRLSPIKDPLTFIRAAALLGEKHHFQVALIGQKLERDREYSTMITEELEQLGKTVPVQFISGIPQSQLPNWYQRCFASVNCSPADHSLDKTVLETMACGKPGLTSVLGFKQTMGREASLLMFRAADAGELALKLENLLKLPPGVVEKMGNDLREQTVQNHSVRSLAKNLTALLDQLKE